MDFVLTKEQLLNAKTYIPLAEKQEFISKNAERCFDKLSITTGEEEMPPMYMENTALKARYLMYAMVSKYLGIPTDADDELMTVEEYDKYAGSHIIMQIERAKKDKITSDICYDLLSDYFDLSKRFDRQIQGLLTVQNDSVVRQQILSASAVKQLPEIMAAINALQTKQGGGAE